MRCDRALAALSAAADHEPLDEDLATELAAHMAACDRCSDFERHVADLRARLRFERVDAAPDVAPAVLARIGPRASGTRRRRNPASGRRPRAVTAAAAAFAAGLVAGAAFVGIGTGPENPAGADIPGLVLEAQRHVHTLEARFELREHGRPAGAAARRFAGHLVYRAPESLTLTLDEDGTPGPGEGDVRLVATGESWSLDAPRRCSPGPGASCPSGTAAWSQAASGREPFSDGAPVPLELVNPVESFALAAEPESLGRRTVAGRDAVGVAVTAAQVAPLLDGLSPAGDLRSVHPSDPVELWLDRDHLVPVGLVARAGTGEARARWAAAHGYDDAPGAVVVAMTATEVRINEPVDGAAFRPPRAGAGTRERDDGFAPGDGSGAPTPADLPAGFRPHRSGTTATAGGPPVDVRTWTDGRAWIKVRATTAWRAPRLFGDLGPDVRVVDLGGAGVGYTSADGGRVALHGDGVDVVVSGSVPPGTLRAVAASLGVAGRPVPDGWEDAASATLGDAVAAAPGLLVATGVDGFGAPAVTVAGTSVTQSYAGPGDRAFVLTRDAAGHLVPPAGGDAIGVEVRGVAGRYSYARGELEWVEGGAAHGLRSATLSLAELLDIADSLEAG